MIAGAEVKLGCKVTGESGPNIDVCWSDKTFDAFAGLFPESSAGYVIANKSHKGEDGKYRVDGFVQADALCVAGNERVYFQQECKESSSNIELCQSSAETEIVLITRDCRNTMKTSDIPFERANGVTQYLRPAGDSDASQASLLDAMKSVAAEKWDCRMAFLFGGADNLLSLIPIDASGKTFTPAAKSTQADIDKLKTEIADIERSLEKYKGKEDTASKVAAGALGKEIATKKEALAAAEKPAELSDDAKDAAFAIHGAAIKACFTNDFGKAIEEAGVGRGSLALIGCYDPTSPEITDASMLEYMDKCGSTQAEADMHRSFSYFNQARADRKKAETLLADAKAKNEEAAKLKKDKKVDEAKTATEAANKATTEANALIKGIPVLLKSADDLIKKVNVDMLNEENRALVGEYNVYLADAIKAAGGIKLASLRPVAVSSGKSGKPAKPTDKPTDKAKDKPAATPAAGAGFTCSESRTERATWKVDKQNAWYGKCRSK